MAQNYNDTIHKMQTPFEMRAGLPKKEPKMLEDWEQNHVYEQMIKNNEGKPQYILHDGPPYANGNIHMGTALNKIIKDIIIRYKNMSGFQAPYVPGYDTHGLPIELKALSSLGDKKAGVSKLELRQICKEFATEHIGVMNEQFKRLGVQGDFENPYLTLRPEFEARQVEIFGEMARKGYIYKGMKAVYWCPEDRTALAEAEIEYAEDECDSIYVRFKLTDDPNGVLAKHNIPLDKAWIVIWTTTTWTLPANVATCLNPNLEYAFVKIGDAYHIMARELVESTMKGCHIDEYEVLPETVLGSELELMQYQHPFLDRKGLVILGDHVTLEGGTGCVHTAPGHGVEDFEVCVNHYPQVPVVVPVDDAGRLTAEAGEKFAGLKVWDANKVILEHIKESGHLMGVQHITHQYPHCWRCHHPIIFRATEQWFCSIDAFKEDVYKAIDSVHWQPAWGHDRMAGMVRDRSDWCISRQRVWGVPIPVFYCKKCGKYHITDASIKAVSDLFRKEGSDAWYKYDANDILPKTEVCECGASDWEKDPDIMDVWFDSGSTWSAVCRERPELRWPVDMYMEGADQFRGWFQSSLLTSVATQGVAPYREVLCHGWVVDAQGKQMHKSAGNGMEPSEIIRDYGADIIRLWVASSDYTVDVRAGKEIFRQLSEAYRKMRNTARFMLGNISDFDPAKDMVDDDQLFEIDHWALEACNKLTATMRDAYEHYDFSRAYHALYNFCVIDMSNFYMDVIKDRLYCADDHARRCAQTALYRILVDFTKLLAPILCFTSQEIWSYIPKLDGMKDYVVFEQMPEAKAAADEAFEAKWDRIMAIRDDVKKVLEQARADKVIGSALEAGLTLYCSKEVYDFLNAIPMDELADLFIVSHVDLVEGEGGVKGLLEGLGVSAAHAAGNKCLRCWKYETTVGEDGLCPRCAKVLKQ
ncbi:MAG: isoleucine--tRNA ligase [Subdoligranulum variabile]|uniref:isoleucine--tRNA ligase n=1 Tax=Gemmiger formicilis TaxID=745368 RepID=UPI001D249FBB|nr:isoleucine--tRNA ligase [Subdoligranulum variabile]MEE0073912.1 isoleucine--tRNA ligase [Gemmiger formicilis]